MRNPRFRVKTPLSVRRSGIHGRGVYAREPIAAGTRIAEYTGERIPPAEADARYPDDPSKPTHTFLFAVDEETVVDAARRGGIAKWINHSCDPNCESVIEGGRIYIDALRDIEPGEELSYDYHFILGVRHSPAMKRRFPCVCGAPECRGTLLGKKR